MDISFRNIRKKVTRFIAQLIKFVITSNNESHAVRRVVGLIETNQLVADFTVIAVAECVQVARRKVGKCKFRIHRHFLR